MLIGSEKQTYFLAFFDSTFDTFFFLFCYWSYRNTFRHIFRVGLLVSIYVHAKVHAGHRISFKASNSGRKLTFFYVILKVLIIQLYKNRSNFDFHNFSTLIHYSERLTYTKERVVNIIIMFIIDVHFLY